VTIRDVSKRKALEEALTRQVKELVELDQIKSDLVSTVSHELRTPLTSLVGHVEMLGDGDLGELTAEQLWAVRAIDRNSHRLLSLIDDLLTLAKIEKGGLGLALTPTDLPDLIEELKPGILTAAAARSIDVSFGAHGDLGVVLADRPGLERALTNVLSNAVKFTPEGGRVAFDVTCDDAHAIFSVSDTGIGVSAEDKERLFTRFFRSAEATSMAIPGTGLGLTIVKKIVDDHGGAINVESSPGVGTTVTLTIPLVPANGLRGMSVATGG
jgi:signal transduction histidine kinase